MSWVFTRVLCPYAGPVVQSTFYSVSQNITSNLFRAQNDKTLFALEGLTVRTVVTPPVVRPSNTEADYSLYSSGRKGESDVDQWSPTSGPRTSTGSWVICSWPTHKEKITCIASFYLLSETKWCFILKNDKILFFTSCCGSLLTHVY